MKTRTAAEAAALGAEAGYGVELRLKVADSGGTLQDISSYVLTARYEASWDAPVSQLTADCARVVGGASLAPDDSASSLNALGPLLAHWRLCTLEVACVPLGTARGSITTWREEFRGRVDDFTVGDDTISIKVLDEGARLQRAHIDAERTYGSDSGTAVETVMGSILSDNGVSWASLTTPSSPAWLLQKYKQDKVPVLDALRKLAEQLGWEVRYWYSASSGKVDSLRFFEPDRDKTAADYTFGPTGPVAYLESPEFRTSGEDLRNVWVGTYSDVNDLDAAGVPKRKTVVRSDATSIAAYGAARCEIAEASSSNINTQAEMERLLDAGLADCKDPKVVGPLPVPYFPWVELGDVIEVLANGASLNQDVLVAVEAYSHEIPLNGVPRTELHFRGTRPTSSMRNWARRQARPAMFSNTNPANENTGPTAPTGLSSQPTVNGFRLKWSPPTTGPRAESYELHVSTSSGFTPTSSTLKWVGAGTEATLADLSPGTTYYAVVVPRTSLTGGDRGTASSQVSVTARWVEPGNLQPLVTYQQIPTNSDFEAANTSGAPPDTWEMHTGTWTTDAVIDTVNVSSGNRAVKLNATAVATKIRSSIFMCREYDLVRVTARLSVVGAFNQGAIYLRWLNSAFTEISLDLVASYGTSFSTSPYADVGAGEVIEAPAGTAYAQVVMGKVSAGTYAMWIDSCRVFIGPTVGTTEAGSALTLGNGFTDASVDGQALYHVDPHGFLYFRGAITRAAGIPASGTVIATLPNDVRPAHTHRFVVATDVLGDVAMLQIKPTGAIEYLSGNVARLWLDGIRFRVLTGG
jgi:hypothetical protein